ncbi:MAG: phosphoribosylglycinamide formyltransferase [Gammaproteobacteria bacterium]|nr:phosphoribosylglycinamide formyltransferase [Gammaproteobacteria bacterium]
MNQRSTPLSLVVLISGNGSNLQAIIDAIAHGELPAHIRAVISNRRDAYGLQRAQQAGIPAVTVEHQQYRGDRQGFDQALMRHIDHYQPDLVVLAGFMRILTPDFVRHYRHRLLNIHPSLLPAYTGLNTHQQALDAGATAHGASVHYVTEELDGGPVISQARVAIHTNDTATTLAQRVQHQEHSLYPQTLALIAKGRITIDNHDHIFIDGNRLEQPLDCTRELP